MDVKHKWFFFFEFFICSPLVKGLSYDDLQNCPLIQYGTIGNSAIVQCDVKPSFHYFFWFEESSDKDPIARYENGSSRRGNESNEFDLTSDGSLVINEVNFTQSRIYTIRALDENFKMVELANINFLPRDDIKMSSTSQAMTTAASASSEAANVTVSLTTTSDTPTGLTTEAPEGLETWIIIIIIVAAVIAVLLIFAFVIGCIRRRDKAKRQKLASPGPA